MHDDAPLTPVQDPATGVTRIVSADARQALEALKASPLLAEGKVCLVGFEAVRARMGVRWPIRREMVYEHFQRTLQRQLGPHGYYLRVSDTDYLVSQPGVGRLAGQAYCLNCLREVLHYFLGEALLSDTIVHEITAIEEGRIAARPLDVNAVDEAEAQSAARAPPPAPTGRTSPPAGSMRMISQDRWTPFVANDGRKLRASCALEPVFQLKTQRRIGYRMVRRVLTLPSETALSPAEVRRLSSIDIEKIDFATLARGLDRISQDDGGERQPTLILPVSFVTLSSHRGRAILADFFRAAQGSVNQGLICEVCDIEGVPPGALLAATSLIRPFCLFVVGRLSEAPTTSLKGLKDAGLQGLSIDCPASFESEADFVAFAKTVTKTIMLYRLANVRQAAMAGLLGATHASLATAQSKVHYVDERDAAAL